jgi:hypothetical protein
MWKQYFKLKKIKPGRIMVYGFGTIDFSNEDLPVELVHSIYQQNFPFLELTDKGQEKFYPEKTKPPNKTEVKK